MRSHFALVPVLVALAVHTTAGQQATQRPDEPSATFRIQVDAVELDAFVTDARGNPVTDLTADDFEITESGKPQTITSFSRVNLPIERAERPLFSPRAIERDVASNDLGEGRIYLIALDEIEPSAALRARLFLHRFIEQFLGINDVAAVVFLGRQRQRDAQSFTNNPRLLLKAIDAYTGGFGELQQVPNPFPESTGSSNSAEAQAEFTRRIGMSNFRQTTEFLASIRGRKAMLFVSESIGLDLFSVLDYSGGVLSLAAEDAHAAITAATRGNVTIYPVDPRGLSPDGGLGENEAAPSADVATGLRLGRDNLRALANITGGFTVGVDSNSFGAGFERIVRENSTYYVLGFSSTNDKRDGKFHKLQVRVKRPGLTVRTRDGYLAPLGHEKRPTTKPMGALSVATSDAIRSPLAISDVPLKVFAAPYKGEGRRATVAMVIEVGVSRLGLVEEQGLFKGTLELGYLAVDDRNKIVPGQHQIMKLALKRDSFERASRDGFRVMSEISLPPGRHELRVAAGNAAGRAGSLVYSVDVPDFQKEPLMMSGVSLTTATAPAVTLSPKSPLRNALPGGLTTAREFTTDDTIVLFAEVYENVKKSQAHVVDIKAELRSDAGRVVRTTSEQRSSSELQGKSGGYGFTGRVPLNDLDAGLYVIHLEAQSSLGARPMVSRDVQVTVK